jgi:hypothetical protein
MGAKVIAVSKHSWMKDSEFGGADYIINDYDGVVDEVKNITEGKDWNRAISQDHISEDIGYMPPLDF